MRSPNFANASRVSNANCARACSPRTTATIRRPRAVALLMTLAALTSTGATGAGASEPTVTDTYNTCQGQTKLPDVYIPVDCKTVRTTYSTRVFVIGKALAIDRTLTVAQKNGTVESPLAMYVRVLARGKQPRRVTWGVACENDDTNDFASSSGSFTTRTSARRQLRMPLTRPTSCSYHAVATTDGGVLRLRVLARLRDKVISREES